MKAKVTCYLIPLLILTIIITFSFFSCSPSSPADQTIEEPAQKTIEENSTGESKEELKEEVIEEEELIEEEQSFEDLEFKCIRVVDGDTIEVEDKNGTKYKVRYIGINTPETDEYYGDIATEKIKSLLKARQ